MASQLSITSLAACLQHDLEVFLPGFSDCLSNGDVSAVGGSYLGDPELDVTTMRCLMLARAFGKKFADECDPIVTDEVALAKFLQANRKCFAWKDRSIDPYTSKHDKRLLGQFKWELYKALNTPNTAELQARFPRFSWDVCLDEPKIVFFGDNGPGAAIGAEGSSWLEKFNQSELTHSTWFLYQSFVAGLRGDRLEAELTRQSKFGSREVSASRLSFVPKTVKESRCIAIEPSLNVFFQKGIQLLLTDQLKAAFGIDLPNQQEKNRLLALLGSYDQSFGTIDLSSASDTISHKMMRCYCPRNVLSWLEMCRTKFVDIPDSHGGQRLRLDMISSMGNAFTFPLQTMIFASAVVAVYNCHGLTATSNIESADKKASIFAVNGDDIIVVKQCYDDVVNLLGLLGFTPNTEKSYNTGYFRESCGCDAFKGYDTRGVYCKTLKRPQDRISLINRLNRWSAQAKVALPKTVGALLSSLEESDLLFVPPFENDDAGIHVPLSASELFEVGQRLKQNDANMKKPYYMGGYYYRIHEYRPSGSKVDEDFVSKYGELAVMLAGLKGEIRAGRFVPRESDGSYRVRGRSAPWWDVARSNYTEIRPLTREELTALDWAVRENLS